MVSDPISALLTSSFTAINGPQAQLCTPSLSSASLPVQQHQGRRRVATTKRRRRNPTVAQYLCLGPSSESNHPEQHVSASDRTRNRSASISKRRKLGNKDDSTHDDMQSGNQNPSIQMRVSEILRVAETRHSAAASSKVFYDKPLISSTTPEQDAATQTSWNLSKQTSGAKSQRSYHDTAIPKSMRTEIDDLVEIPSSLYAFRNYPVTPLPTSEVGREMDVFYQITSGSSTSIVDDDDEDFNDDLNDEEFLELTSQIAYQTGDPTDSLSSPCHSDSTHTVYVGEECTSPATKLPASAGKEDDHGNCQCSSKKFVSPMTLTSRLLASTGDIDFADARKPIVRSPFPEAVRDRSPIIGLSSDTILRTCFRVGEAINQAHQSSKNGKHVVLELYARILVSSRDDAKQNFTFCDLFHGKPPHVKGIYDGARWQSVQLFDYDSKRLLQQGRICRCMGTMKRDDNEWIMSVSGIWEATWNDIKWVQGIVNA